MSKKVTLPLTRRKPSKSGDPLRAERLAEELAMTPRERVLQALELGAWIDEVLVARARKAHEEP